MLQDCIVCKTDYSKIGNIKIKGVPYKLSLEKRCAGLVSSLLSLLFWRISLQMALMWRTWAITIIPWKPVTAWTQDSCEPTTTLMEKNHWRLAHGCNENRGNSFNLGLWEHRMSDSAHVPFKESQDGWGWKWQVRKRSSGPRSLPKQGHPETVAWNYVEMFLFMSPH